MRLLLFFLISVNAELVWKCPRSWHIDLSSNICYKVFHQDVHTHVQAARVCSSNNASLAIMRSNQTLEVIDDIFQRGWRIPKKEFPADRVWVASHSPRHSSLQISANPLDCLSFKPTRALQKAEVLSIPCALLNNRDDPAQHVLCEAKLAVEEEAPSLFCDEGWSLFLDRKVCHKLFKVGISSKDGAYAFCHAHSANISMMLSDEEKQFVQDILTSGWKAAHDLRFPMNQVWIGMKKIRGDLKFEWENGVKSMDNNMFAINEPNGKHEDEPCVSIHPFDIDKQGRKGALSDHSCDIWQFNSNIEEIVNQILCEKPATELKSGLPETSLNAMKPCIEDWDVLGNGEKCHKFFQIGITTMDGAEKICKANGGRLSSIQTKDEVRFVTDLMLRGWKMDGNNTFYNHVWVSLRKDVESGEWIWNGKEALSGEIGKVLPNHLEVSNCAAFQPMSFLEGKNDFFGEVPCDTALHGYVYPPSHILCERDHDGSTISSKFISPECPRNWHFYEKDGMCIKVFVEDTLSYQQAQNRCSSEGGNLVSLNTQDKLDFVIGLTRIGWRPKLISGRKSLVWVGLIKEGNSWQWLNGETLNSKLKFHVTGNVKDQKHCGTLFPFYGDLKDFECELSGSPVEHLICEKESSEKGSKKSQIYVRLALCIIIFVFLVTSLCIIYRLLNKKSGRKEYRSDSYSFEKLLGSDMTLDCAAPFLSYDTAFEIPTKNVELIQELGHGYFGIVWKAKLHHPRKLYSKLDVAVKHVRDIHDKEQCDSIATEIKFLSKVGQHPNVIRFIGATTSRQSRYGHMLIMEYCSNGNLKDHLISMGKNRPKNKHEDSTMAQFALQIANGMQYLSSIPCIHRDLAARNILLTDDFMCKITDFGLAKNEDYYKSSTPHCLPLRWMSPEAIENRRFTIQSDIWSFGIVLFEIYSFGSTPYPGISQNDLIPVLLSGTINEIPEATPPKIATLTNHCWSKPNDRPTFSECFSLFKEYLLESYPESLAQLQLELDKIAKSLSSFDEWLPSGKKQSS